jgi:aspartyl-tRNA(Asn)/glutamyl-tRNA(Gln) amidotransferase subunit C
MAGGIDQAQVRHVAKLARLELTDQEVAAFSTQLSAILEYVQKLNELDTTGLEPLAHCLAIHNVFREDQVKPSLPPQQVLANAPDRDEQFFRVPKILDDGSGA